jgi:aryl-alcohol dehydrogenase-like predicted oxidoreductase
MEYRALGRTGIRVSSVCLGTWALIGDETWGEQNESDSAAALDAALDAGVNFLDTAEMYGAGRSEELLGRLLGARRRKIVLASKVGSASLKCDALKEHCEASLKRLRTDYLDLYQVHWPNPDVPIAETLGALGELQAAGKVRAIGVSNFGTSYLSELLAAGRAESNQLCYSLLWRGVEFEVQPMCVKHGLSILCYSALCQGLLTGKFRSADEVPVGRARTRLFASDRPMSRHREHSREVMVFAALDEIRKIAAEAGRPMGHVALAWLLSRPGVASVITGARNAAQARDNAAAAGLKLNPDVLRRLSAATEAIKQDVGSNADMWQTDSRMERKP